MSTNNGPSVRGTSRLFFPTRPARSAPSLASLEQTYLLRPPPRASPRSRSPGASVPPTRAQGGDPCPDSLPQTPCPTGPSPLCPKQGGSGPPPPWPLAPRWEPVTTHRQPPCHRLVRGGAAPEPALGCQASASSAGRWVASPSLECLQNHRAQPCPPSGAGSTPAALWGPCSLCCSRTACPHSPPPHQEGPAFLAPSPGSPGRWSWPRSAQESPLAPSGSLPGLPSPPGRLINPTPTPMPPSPEDSGSLSVFQCLEGGQRHPCPSPQPRG